MDPIPNFAFREFFKIRESGGLSCNFIRNVYTCGTLLFLARLYIVLQISKFHPIHRKLSMYLNTICKMCNLNPTKEHEILWSRTMKTIAQLCLHRTIKRNQERIVTPLSKPGVVGVEK